MNIDCPVNDCQKKSQFENNKGVIIRRKQKKTDKKSQKDKTCTKNTTFSTQQHESHQTRVLFRSNQFLLNQALVVSVSSLLAALLIGNTNFGIWYQQRGIYSICRFCWNVDSYKWKIHSGKIQSRFSTRKHCFDNHNIKLNSVAYN